MLDDLLKLADYYPPGDAELGPFCGHKPAAKHRKVLWPQTSRKIPQSQHDPAGGAGAQGRHSLQGVPRVLRDRQEEAPPLPRTGQYLGRCATPATSQPRRPRPSQWSFTRGPRQSPRPPRQSPSPASAPAGRDQAGRLQPPLPPSPLQVEGPARFGQHDRRARACTHKQLPELFPLMASLCSELQPPTDSPSQRRPLKQRRTHCDLEQVWDCILRKLSMPF